MSHNPRTSCRRCARRGGSLYIVVMGVGMIVGVIALTSSAIGRLELRSAAANSDASRAALAARSGLEFALNWLNRTPDWRAQLISGDNSDAIHLLGGAYFRWLVTDADGDLDDDPRDHAMLRSVGYFNEAVAAMEVGIEPSGRGLTCLEAAAHAQLLFEAKSGSTITGAGFVSSNDDVMATTATFGLDAEAYDKVLGGTYSGTKTEGVRPREMPGDHVLDYYLARGTEIPLSSVPSSFGMRHLNFKLMSRWLNDVGEVNPYGIYWIDLAGESLDLKWSRVLGTLVLLNAGPNTACTDVAIHQANPLNAPCLIVQGDLKIDLRNLFTGTELRESGIFNYNPPGMPFNGEEDSDKSDVRNAVIEGVVYVTGMVIVRDTATVRGCLIANNICIEANKTLTLDYRPYAMNYPPPGFSAGQGVRVLPGSWRRTSQ
ncbi:hypothetical protein [Botrimarina hoheduenensis]|uniref:Uncharacterized protein n=1 Tax=Botrimarina hoheduenensis TaxID=2528000 RepID=A0A5C5W9M4_9BACT|nr:hypothetical protein [Botrimarina hoheduenensis]TWT47568.1 hypothetical protein Pla111_11830 [Botrimarina hoheduenensis]